MSLGDSVFSVANITAKLINSLAIVVEHSNSVVLSNSNVSISAPATSLVNRFGFRI
nr:MAG TPA: hypothetical protein [Caudoviricetes sp.]